MDRRIVSSASSLLLPAILLAPVRVLGDELPPLDRPTAASIAARVMAADEARMSKLRDYTSLRHYSLDNKRFGVRATMTVRVSYQFPGKKHFEVIEESGPSAIRNKVFRRMLDSELQASAGKGREETRISPRNYDFVSIGMSETEGRPCFLLEAEPKTKNPLLFRGRVCIDREDYALASLDGAPAQNPSFWLSRTAIVHRYRKFGPFWMPVSNESDSEVKIFGHTRVRIEYSDYKINVEEPESPPAPTAAAR